MPEECWELLNLQRTDGSAANYSQDLQTTFDSFKNYLPKRCEKVLDIGAGMGGIDVFISQHYEHNVSLVLLDKEGKSPIKYGFAPKGKEAAHYHSFEQAFDLLTLNDVPDANIDFINARKGCLDNWRFDVVVSLLSWGFHYSLETYCPIVNTGGIIVVDVRNGTGEERLLKNAIPIHRAAKYTRWLSQC